MTYKFPGVPSRQLLLDNSEKELEIVKARKHRLGPLGNTHTKNVKLLAYKLLLSQKYT